MVTVERRYCAIIEYDGTDFLGYQIQAKGRTVQGEIEQSLKAVTQSTVRINGAGRTDAGVHATGQVIAFDVAWRHTRLDLQRALNATLPSDIVISSLRTVDPNFHPRYSAISRTYQYTVVNQECRPVLQRRYAHYVREPLNVVAMNQAGKCLVGTFDFASFGKPPTGSVTIRNVTQALWTVNHQQFMFEITANAFLYRMVRKLVGTLIQVGLGQLSVGEIQEILEARDLRRSAPPVPARGLSLVRVTYPKDVWGTP